jgi:hypothetical protein
MRSNRINPATLKAPDTNGFGVRGFIISRHWRYL